MESLLTHERIKVYVERDIPLRAREYVVVITGRETGEETGNIIFRVADSGKCWSTPIVQGVDD